MFRKEKEDDEMFNSFIIIGLWAEFMLAVGISVWCCFDLARCNRQDRREMQARESRCRSRSRCEKYGH